jgi:hypothetical protein
MEATLSIMDTTDTSGLIDNRNISLWNELLAVHEINIQREKRLDYLAYSKNNTTTIYVPIDNIDSASFTHELLHVWLRTKDIFIGGGLTMSIKSSRVLLKIFSDNLIEHIGNCLDHIKMLPEFNRLGYDTNEFLSDSFVNKLTEEDLNKIRNYFVISTPALKIYNSTAIDFFIGKYFAAIACPNITIDYVPQLNSLKKIDDELYQILEDFSNAWANFDYSDKNPITGSYNILLFDFIDNLENWTVGKTII